MLPYVLGALLLSALSVFADDKHSCYWRRLDQIVIKDNLGWFQCNNTQTSNGGAQLCCRNGDRCGDDSICHSDAIADSLSAWYVGGCSDGSYSDPVCNKNCTQFKQTWIQWNQTEHQWNCCGDYDCDGNYTAQTFKAVSPADWEPIPQTGNFQPDNTGANHGIELSTGAKIGIGVGAACAAIAVLALVAVCCIRRRRPAERKTFGNGKKGTYARLGPQHEMAPYAGAGGGQGMARSREASPAPASRGVSPSREALVGGYGGVEAPSAAARAVSMYPDRVGAGREMDEGA